MQTDKMQPNQININNLKVRLVQFTANKYCSSSLAKVQ